MVDDKPMDAGAPEDEITPEMIAAGASVLAGYDTYFAGPELWAKRTYMAMRLAALRAGVVDSVEPHNCPAED